MQIKPMVYENLTASQRVIAVIEAEARDDDAEVQRLVKSCPKKTYRMNDAAFVETMQSLTHTTLWVECILQRNAVALMVALFMDKEESIDPILQNIADIRAAWEEVLKSMGINPETLRKSAALDPLLMECFEELMPAPDPEYVAILAGGMKRAFD
jgi:hypothetical protein